MKRLIATLSILALGATLSAGARADIAVATAGPMTGSEASFGAQMRAGAEMAVKDINEAGGVLGQQLKLYVEDDVCDPKQAVAVANKAASEGVVFVSGHYCSGSSIPASKVYTEEGIVQISPASTNPAFTDEGSPNIFRVCGRDDQQGAAIGDYVVNKLGDKKIAIVHDKSAYGKGLADETKAVLERHGKTSEMYEAITPGEKDYLALVTKLKAANIDYIIFGGYKTEAGLIVRQMRDQGMNTKLIGGDALVTKEFWSITGDSGEGTLNTFSPDPRKNADAAPLVAKFKAAGIEPEGYVLYTYATFQAWKQAVEKAGTVDPAKVAAALHSGTVFDTVIGKLTFNEKGDVNLPGYVMYVWSKGDYDYAQ
jgi:branched-chain amino acid transport system substrate-binding protein